MFLLTVVAMMTSTLTLGQSRKTAICEPAAVLSADAAWAKAAAAKDLEALMNPYDASATQWPASGKPIVGKAALRNLFDRLFADPDYSLSWKAERVRVAKSCDVAYTLGRWEIRSRNREGQLTTSRGTYLAVWRADNAKWLVVEDMFNLAGE